MVKVGAAGFCWGGSNTLLISPLPRTFSLYSSTNMVGACVVGMAVVRLAKYDCIDAAVLLHPGPITQDQINGAII